MKNPIFWLAAFCGFIFMFMVLPIYNGFTFGATVMLQVMHGLRFRLAWKQAEDEIL